MRGTDLLIVVQIHGQVQLKLTPTACERTCHMIESVLLAAGEMGK